MCDWMAYFNKFNSQGMYQGQFAQQVINSVEPGICPGQFCRTRLSYKDMHPNGRMTRHLCQNCYQAMFNRINYQCVVSASDISHKVHLQKRNWREIRNHICDDQNCLAMWALIHASVIGEAQRVIGGQEYRGNGQSFVQQMLQNLGRSVGHSPQHTQRLDQNVMNRLPQHQRNATSWGDYFEDNCYDPGDGRKVKVIHLSKG
ncbi:MAG: hypothetical protein U5L00_07685 [Desulfovermiculus sp.]|nr:hypothetical protein [Desulfovermiculus sp.]